MDAAKRTMKGVGGRRECDGRFAFCRRHHRRCRIRRITLAKILPTVLLPLTGLSTMLAG